MGSGASSQNFPAVATGASAQQVETHVKNFVAGDLLTYHQTSGDVDCQVIEVYEDGGSMSVWFQNDDCAGIVMCNHCSIKEAKTRAPSLDAAEDQLTSDVGRMPQGSIQTEWPISPAEKRPQRPDDVEAQVKQDTMEMPQRKRACTRFGAFSASGCFDQGVQHKARIQGRALPSHEYPFRLSRHLYQSDGTRILFSEYLKQKKEQGAFKPDSIFEMEVSEKADFSHPFTVFVSTIGMVADGIIHGHEAFWPLCCWGATDLKLGQTVSEEVGAKLKDIANLPVFVHVNAANEHLTPITETGPGRSPWGVRACGEDGFDTQQAFWSTSPMSQGTHGWRLLAEANMFAARGTEDVSGLRDMIKSATKVYDAVA